MFKFRLFIWQFLIITISFFLLVDCCSAQSTRYVEKPLWEVTLFGGVAAFPEYRGSDEYSVYALPLPYFIYRGEYLQSDKDGVRRIFSKSKFHEIFISLSGNPPVESDNKVKTGMPDLDAIFEIGPVFKWYLNGIDANDPVYFKVEMRSAFSINIDSGLNVDYQGQHGDVSLNWEINNPCR